jgi:hypothetical protein
MGKRLPRCLDLRAQPRGTGASDSNFRCYRFDDAGEQRLCDWMYAELRVAVAPYPEPPASDKELIALACPPLNLTGWGESARRRDQGSPEAYVDEARRNFPR